MLMNQGQLFRMLGLATIYLAASARADTVEARCDIYPRGSDKAAAVLPCSF